MWGFYHKPTSPDSFPIIQYLQGDFPQDQTKCDGRPEHSRSVLKLSACGIGSGRTVKSFEAVGEYGYGESGLLG